MDQIQKVTEILTNNPFDQYGVVPLNSPLSFDIYKKWVERGMCGSMNYLRDHMDLKENPKRIHKDLKSAIVFTASYLPMAQADRPVKSLKVAKYAHLEDYHRLLPHKLEPLVGELSKSFPEHQFVVATDSFPFLERDWAYQAGLGWVGKNTCLIHPEWGSYFFIVEILTTLNLKSSEPRIQDFCGTCQNCLEACPTGAIVEPRVLDARKCISYWNIESSQAPPKSIRENMGGWLFGCDICQDVCPWNHKYLRQKIHQQVGFIENKPDRSEQVAELKEILHLSNRQLAKKFKRYAIERAAGSKLKRNALIVIANEKLKELREDVLPFVQDKKWSELARWVLSCL